MVKRNPNLERLHKSYFFVELEKRRNDLLERHKKAAVINLGIGDTTLPLPGHVVHMMQRYCADLGSRERYQGYGPCKGIPELRQAIADRWYSGGIDPEDIFISDGAKCAVGRLQTMFGPGVTIGVQDPVYPAYVSSSVIMGQSGKHKNEKDGYENIVYLPCLPENNFFPDLSKVPSKVDVLFICSPNNPTGAVATHAQLIDLVSFAKKNNIIIIFDAAYAAFIKSPDLPRSIYEVTGAEEVAIEINSFSKFVGFTGVRLGWTVVPRTLKYQDGSSVQADFSTVSDSYFGGPSRVAQIGGLAALDDEGFRQALESVDYYRGNAAILKEAIEAKGYSTYGGEHCPYVWARFEGHKSWDIFDHILFNTHILSAPGSGFGPSGEGFLRFSAFGTREKIQEAAERLKQSL